MLTFLVAFFSFACWQAISGKPYYPKDEIFTLPVTFHPDVSSSLASKEIAYWKIVQCNAPYYSQIQVAFILPDNPTWKLNVPYIFAELSVCPDSFNASCVFATNYVYNNGNPVVYSNITIDVDSNNSVDNIFLRVTAPIGRADFSFEFTYVENNQLFDGPYDSRAFVTSQVNGQMQSVSQYAKSESTETVSNNNVQYYFVQFCVDNFGNPNTNWYATINVASAPDRPKSAFEVWACSADNSPTACTALTNDGEDLSGVSIVAVTLHNPSVNLNPGLYVALYGIGGEYDSQNEGIISITTSINS